MTRSKKILGVSACALLCIGGFVACSSSNDDGGNGTGTGGNGGGGLNLGGKGGSSTEDSGTGTGGNGTGGKDASAGGKGGGSSMGGASGWTTEFTPPACEPPKPIPDAGAQCLPGMNREGCPCDKVDETVKCFSGAPENRNRGICADGTTKCVRIGEMTQVWDKCVGEKLPEEGATSGAGACRCFTYGDWRMENANICIWGSDPYGPVYGELGAMSTLYDPATKKTKCDNKADPMATPPVLPSSSWSKNWLKSDCSGTFKLCYRVMAGDPKATSPDDCLLTEVCTTGEYKTPGVEQQMPDLPAWTSNNVKCAQRWWNVGGWGEMAVIGESIECDPVPPRIFTKIGYCPAKCGLEENKDHAECLNCTPFVQHDF